jgi:hypothetical protein
VVIRPIILTIVGIGKRKEKEESIPQKREKEFANSIGKEMVGRKYKTICTKL